MAARIGVPYVAWRSRSTSSGDVGEEGVPDVAGPAGRSRPGNRDDHLHTGPGRARLGDQRDQT